MSDSTKHAPGLVEPRDTELDLSEADFAPAAVLLKSCVANGNELDNESFNTAVSDSSLPLHDERHVAVSATFSHEAHATCDGVQNGEANVTASFQHDAIGLPLCAENPATSDCYGTLTVHNDVLLQHNSAAAESLSMNCEDHTGSDIVRSADDLVTTIDLSSKLNTSTPISSHGAQDIARPHNELSTCLTSDKNITCEAGDTVDTVNTDRGNIVCSGKPQIDGGDLSCKTGSEIELSEQNNGSMQLDVDDAQHIVADECRDVSVPCDDIRSSGAQSVEEVQGEVEEDMEVQIQQRESLSVDDVKGFETGEEDLRIVRETQVGEEDSADDLDELNDECIDEVDKMVSTSCRVKSDSSSARKSGIDVNEVDYGVDEVDKTVCTAYHVPKHLAHDTVRSIDADATVYHDNDHLLGHTSDSSVTVAACSESSWFEAVGTQTCGTDHVERITTDNIARSRVELHLDNCSDLIDEELTCAAFGLEFSHVTDVHEAVNVNEESVCATVSEVLCELDDSVDSDAVTSNVPVDAQSSVDTVDHIASSSAESTVRLPEERPADIADGTFYVPAADKENLVHVSKSLQKQVSEETHMCEMIAVTQSDNEPSSVNDGGDAQSIELCEKERDRDGSNSLLVFSVNSAVAQYTEPVADSDQSVVEGGHDVQLNGDVSDVTVEKITAKDSAELPLQNLDFSIADSRNEEQDSCGLNNTVMPNTGSSELTEFKETVSGESMSVDTSPFNENVSNSLTVVVEDNERVMPVVDAVAETQTQSTDDLPVQYQDQMADKGQSDGGPAGLRGQSDQDAEQWFEEQFAACEDFDVEEFVSAAWSEFHADLTDLTPAVGNIHDEMLKQNPAAVAATVDDDNDSDGEAGEFEAADVGSADTWHHVENAAVAASAVDDSMHTSTGEVAQFADSDMDAAASYVSLSTAPHSEPSAPGIIDVCSYSFGLLESQ